MRGDGDGWVFDSGARYWGLHGAAGLLLRAPLPDGDMGVLLQHRAVWSDQGGTWGLPGGARDSHESAVDTAIREAGEEAGIVADQGRRGSRHPPHRERVDLHDGDRRRRTTGRHHRQPRVDGIALGTRTGSDHAAAASRIRYGMARVARTHRCAGLDALNRGVCRAFRDPRRDRGLRAGGSRRRSER